MWPELFEIPFLGITLKTYGLMVALGFLVALWTASRRAARMGVPPEEVSDLAFWVIVGGIAGARLFYVVQYADAFRGAPLDALKVWQGGLVFYGGFVGAVAAGLFYARWRNLDPWPLGDCIAPSVMLGYALGRVGCFLNGCCWGRLAPEGAWYAVSFPAAVRHDHDAILQPAFLEHLSRGWVFPGDPASLPVVPVQIISALAGVALFFVLDWRLAARRYPGQTFFWMLMGYAVYRFGVEFLRDDTPLLGAAGSFPGLTIAQWTSPLLFAVALIWASVVSRRRG